MSTAQDDPNGLLAHGRDAPHLLDELPRHGVERVFPGDHGAEREDEVAGGDGHAVAPTRPRLNPVRERERRLPRERDAGDELWPPREVRADDERGLEDFLCYEQRQAVRPVQCIARAMG